MGIRSAKITEAVHAYIVLHARELAWGSIIFLVATTGFGLGYIACRQFNHTPIIIEQCAPQDRPASGK